MSTGSLSFIGSAAGTALAQAKGSEVSRTQTETARQARHTDAAQQSEDAAGIGQTEQDEQTADRDADGRRVWEIGPDGKRHRAQPDSNAAGQLGASKDPTGQAGKQLDLCG